MGYIQNHFSYISLNYQSITKTGICKNRWGFFKGPVFGPKPIIEHTFSRISLQYFRPVKCVVSGKEKKTVLLNFITQLLYLGKLALSFKIKSYRT